MILTAFVSLPFSSFQKDSKNVTSYIRTVDRTYVEKTIKNGGAILIDARTGFQFNAGHIPGAINIPYNNNRLLEFYNKHGLETKPLIVYCSDPNCPAAEILSRELANIGYKNIALYAGGWKDWIKHR